MKVDKWPDVRHKVALFDCLCTGSRCAPEPQDSAEHKWVVKLPEHVAEHFPKHVAHVFKFSKRTCYPAADQQPGASVLLSAHSLLSCTKCYGVDKLRSVHSVTVTNNFAVDVQIREFATME